MQNICSLRTQVENIDKEINEGNLFFNRKGNVEHSVIIMNIQFMINISFLLTQNEKLNKSAY